MKRASYRHAIAWIGYVDSPGEADALDVEVISGLVVDDPTFGNEGRQFADWCQSIGIEVCRVERYGSPHRDKVIDGLWEMYCR